MTREELFKIPKNLVPKIKKWETKLQINDVLSTSYYEPDKTFSFFQIVDIKKEYCFLRLLESATYTVHYPAIDLNTCIKYYEPILNKFKNDKIYRRKILKYDWVKIQHGNYCSKHKKDEASELIKVETI